MKHISQVLPGAIANLERNTKAEHILRQHAAGIEVSEIDLDWAARIALAPRERSLTQPDQRQVP